MEKPKVLIVDDDRAVCTSISLMLRRAGFDCHSLHQPKAIEDELENVQPNLIILDMNFTIDTSGTKGLEVLARIRKKQPELPVILMTGWATIQLAVEGMKRGAKDFIAKPWDNKQLLSSVKTLLALNTKKIKSDSKIMDFDHIIGQDSGFLEVLDMAKRVSQTDANVLILGESGTGKEVLAEAIHYNSLRAKQDFVKVNLGGISSTLFESELFGHVKGAFTDAVADRKGRFELADKGTLFLDEIGELELGSQVKLLRVLQERTFEVLGSSVSKKVDIRVISATNKDLDQMVLDDSFREDLFYRINLIKLVLPPLRSRPGDIPLLSEHFLESMQITYGKRDLRILPEAKEWLSKQQFPGNIRQLKNLIERTVLMARGNTLSLNDFASNYQHTAGSKQVNLPEVGVLSLEDIEIEMINKTMNYHSGNISAVARSLGLTRSALYRRLQKYNMDYET